MRRLGFEIVAMVLVVVLAGLSIVATFGSARSGDLVFCRMVDGGVVVGVTTDCSDVVDGRRDDISITDPSAGTMVGASRRLVAPGSTVVGADQGLVELLVESAGVP